MSNSLVNANITLSIQDQLAATTAAAQSFVDRIVPQFQFPATVAVYSGYNYVAGTGTPIQLVTGAQNCLFCFVRCATGGPIILDYTPGHSLIATDIVLSAGGIFLFGNTSSNTTPGQQNYITSVALNAYTSSQQGVFEYLVAY